MVTGVNYCELKKNENIKRRLLLYLYYNVACYYNVIFNGLIFHNQMFPAKKSAWPDLRWYKGKIPKKETSNGRILFP